MRAGNWAQEGGADAAAAMLRRYDASAGGWDLEQTGTLWNAVRYAHELGRTGEGHTIAVIDDGFDTSIPALSRQELAWTSAENRPAAHGTVVALLILEVAPAARVLLFPIAEAGRLNNQLIERALDDVTRIPATIVNLSLGQRVSGGAGC
jgi:subtilisin family serine protease